MMGFDTNLENPQAPPCSHGSQTPSKNNPETVENDPVTQSNSPLPSQENEQHDLPINS
jgi:hypothetical protein